MSYHDNSNSIGVIGGATIFAAFLLSGGIARTVGADITIVFTAFLWSCAILVVAGVVCWIVGRAGCVSLSLTGSASLVLIWPSWWKVLDSIAAGDSDKTSLLGSLFSQRDSYSPFPDFGPPVEWYNDSLFKWGVEATLISLLIFCIWRNRRHY